LLIEEDEGVDDSHKDHSVPLTGWKVCWLWIPALCDLTATTVCGLDVLRFYPLTDHISQLMGVGLMFVLAILLNLRR
jgi:hypothetical protein